jgi:probable F420-dependent oxidoreductase
VTNLSVIPYRNPLLLAKSAATLNRMSDGRFYLGAGAGYLKSEYYALGVDFEERNALFEEALQVMQLHWGGEPFTFEGRHFSARDIQALPAPRNHSVPIWMGGNSNAALRRAAKYAAGWMPMTAPASVAKTARTPPVTTTEELRERLDVLKRFAGDRYDELELIMGYSGPGLSRLDQEAERARDRLGELEGLGVDWVFVGPPWSPAPGPVEWLKAFAATFITG